MKHSYRLSNVQAQVDLIRAAWDRQKAHADILRLNAGEQPDPFHSPFNLPLAIRRCATRAHTHLHGRSKYMPHQGKQECARRERQFTEGWSREMQAPLLFHFGVEVRP